MLILLVCHCWLRWLRCCVRTFRDFCIEPVEQSETGHEGAAVTVTGPARVSSSGRTHVVQRNQRNQTGTSKTA